MKKHGLDYLLTELRHAAPAPAPAAPGPGPAAPAPAPRPPPVTSDVGDDDSDSDSFNDRARRPKRKQTRKSAGTGGVRRVEPAPHAGAYARRRPQPPGRAAETVFEPTVAAVPNVLDGPQLEFRKIERIREIFSNIFSEKIVYPDNATLASQILEHDIAPVLRTKDPNTVRSANPMIFQTVGMLMEMFTAPDAAADEAAAEMINLRVIESVTRDYEEQQLYSPVGQERACVAAADCICLKHKGFKMKEFLTPLEKERVLRTGQMAPEHKPCLMCIRESCLFGMSYGVVNELPFSPRFSAQSHRNLVDVPGEYYFRDCIPTGHTLIYPMVMNRMEAYKVHKANDVYYLTQDGYDRVPPPQPTPDDHAEYTARQALAATGGQPDTARQGF
jgi:hypothetical protein